MECSGIYRGPYCLTSDAAIIEIGETEVTRVATPPQGAVAVISPDLPGRDRTLWMVF